MQNKSKLDKGLILIKDGRKRLYMLQSVHQYTIWWKMCVYRLHFGTYMTFWCIFYDLVAGISTPF